MSRKRNVASGGATWTGTMLAAPVALGLVAAGATQATALPLLEDTSVVGTTALGTGVIAPVLDANESILVANHGANALLVYPPVGGTVNGGAVNAGISVLALKNAQLTGIGGLNLVASISA